MKEERKTTLQPKLRFERNFGHEWPLSWWKRLYIVGGDWKETLEHIGYMFTSPAS